MSYNTYQKMLAEYYTWKYPFPNDILEEKSRVSRKTKTEERMEEWMNTAVSKNETPLKKHDLGFLHEPTRLLFNDEFMVIGKLDGDNCIVPLSKDDIEVCEENCWKF